jgi:hypothetical protein
MIFYLKSPPRIIEGQINLKSVEWSILRRFLRQRPVSIVQNWFQSCKTGFNRAKLVSIVQNRFQSCKTGFNRAKPVSIVQNRFQLWKTGFNRAKPVSIVENRFQLWKTGFNWEGRKSCSMFTSLIVDIWKLFTKKTAFVKPELLT